MRAKRGSPRERLKETLAARRARPPEPARVRLVTLGQMTLDDIVTVDGRCYPATVGGNALYSALGAALWLEDGQAGPVCRMGRGFPPLILDRLAERLALDGIRPVTAEHVRAWLLYERDGSRRALGRNDDLLPYPPTTPRSFALYLRRYRSMMARLAPQAADVPPAFRGAQAIHVAPQVRERHLANVPQVRRWYPLVSLDPSPEDVEGGALGPLLRHVDCFLPSRQELAGGRGRPPVDRLARAWVRRGPRVVCIKLGADGCLVFDRGRRVRVPAPEAGVVDLTGAGDAFCGGFLAGYLLTGDAAEAALMGSVSAAFAVEGIGLEGLLRAGRRTARRRVENLRRRLSHA